MIEVVMRTGNNAIIIIPSECFSWRPRVRFMESFPTRATALGFAFQHNCNLIVENDQGSIPIFDVMQDPDGACTAGLDLQLLKTDDVLVESPPAGWITLMFWTFWDLAKRFAVFIEILYARQIVPLSRRTTALVSLCFREIARSFVTPSPAVGQIVRSASRQRSWAVATPNYSDPSRLR